jgi:hypothetical protein
VPDNQCDAATKPTPSQSCGGNPFGVLLSLIAS